MLDKYFFQANQSCAPLTLLLSLCLTLLPSQTHALPDDADQPIVIRANEGQINKNANQATYSGDVQVDQGTLRVNAAKMVVDYRNKKVTRITFTGAPAHYQQQLNKKKEAVRAKAQTIVYHTQEELLNLVGQAFLFQEGNEITGDTIDYDIVQGQVRAKSVAATSDTPESGGRIKMVLQPDRKPKTSSEPSSNSTNEP